HWELAFPEVFFDEYGRSLGDAAGFDAVIGNPPYGDLLTEEAKNFTSQTSDMRTGGRAEIYATFLAVSFEVLKKRTSLGFIIPNTLIDGAQFSTLREYLSSEAKIDFVRDYRNRLVFADANVLTMLIFLKNEQEKASYLAPYEFWDDEKNGLVEAEFEITPDSDTPWHVTNIVLRKLKSTKQFALLDPEIAECRDAGVDYKWKNVGWQNRGKREPLSKVLFYSGYKKHPDDYPLIKGENIDRYHVQHADNYVIHDFLKYKTVENTILVYLDLALVPIKILTRQTSARIQAAVDINQYVTAKSVHTTIIKDTSYSVYFVQSVMNSSLMNYVYSMRKGEVGRTFAQIKLYDLRDLPIRRISFHTPQEQKTAVLATAKTHYQQAVQDY
ncbi:MAG: Eco57I restriction-modification methylase domain-containing protein, partial [Anaerolineae bacterium]